jgi:hypothetical protein
MSPRIEEPQIPHSILSWLVGCLFMDIPVLSLNSNNYKKFTYLSTLIHAVLFTASYAFLPLGASVSTCGLLKPVYPHVPGPSFPDCTRTLAPLPSLIPLPQTIEYTLCRLYHHCTPPEIHCLNLQDRSLTSALLTC